LVEYPPKLQPAPVKPYFFDIAYNYIGVEETKGTVKMEEPKVEKKEEMKVEQTKKGWFW
jgi:signal recognition particle subunit SRP68